MSPSEQRQALADALVDDLGDWIDQYVIARTIVEAIEEECGVEATMQPCRDVWLRVLDTLGPDLHSIARNLSASIDYP